MQHSEAKQAAIDAFSRTSFGGQALAAKDASGGEVNRDELLAAIAAGRYVELYFDAVVYEQTDGEMNRNCVKIKPSALARLAKSGKGIPFLRDHEQSELEARGGQVVKSALDGSGGTFKIVQTIKATAPWAVEALLRGNVDRFSVGWASTGPVLCSACKSEIFTDCYHFPGDTVGDGDSETCVEWVYTSAELVEVSAVNVPAVVSTKIIDGIRSHLSARGILGKAPKETIKVNEKLCKALGIAVTASEDEVTKAVEKMAMENAQLATQREISAIQATDFKAVAERCAALEGQVAALSEQGKKARLAAFLTEARATKGIAENSSEERSLSRLYELDPTFAAEHLAGMPRVTPVGASRQSASPEVAPRDTKEAAIADRLPHGVSLAAVKALIAKGGRPVDADQLTQSTARVLGIKGE